MSSSARLAEAQALRDPPYPGFATAFLYSDWALTPELVRVPYDIGTDPSTRQPTDLDFDQWLDVIQGNVVDIEAYITVARNLDATVPHSFAYIAPPQEPFNEDNPCVESHLGLHFTGRILVVAMDSSSEIVEMQREYLPFADRVLLGKDCWEVGNRLHASKNMSATVARSVEIMDLIFNMCSLTTLLSFASADQAARAVFLDYLASRTRKIMSQYLPLHASESFFALLQSTRAGMTGSVALILVCCDIVFTSSDVPRDLNLLVPLGTFDLWRNWLLRHGATRLPHDRIMARFKPALAQFAAFCLTAGQGRKIRFTVSESAKDSILFPLLHSELTSQMTVVTASNFLILYPKLTTNLTSVVGWCNMKRRENDAFLFHGLTIHHTSKTLHGVWEGPCGSACGMLWRRTNGAGIANIGWGGYDGNLESVVEYHNFRWRLARLCDNRVCDRYYSGFRF
ncbi:hypothetical protein B0H11DRAFT_2263412 [Mycena galericulata]|nr:hypothetical protein B0H11DRAFT_2263412 [Mycena galericulata]